MVLWSAGLFAVTESSRYGDAPLYADNLRALALIDPGHLIWRPLGWLLAAASGRLATASDALWALQFLSLAASVAAVPAMYFLAGRLYSRPVALLMALLLAVSNGFWAYAFSGCSYSLSVLFQILALYAAIAPAGEAVTPRRALLAGVLGGLAAAAWTIQLIAAPAIALLIAGPLTRARLAVIVRTGSALALGYVLSFIAPLLALYAARTSLGAAAYAGSDPSTLGFLAWLASSGHGIAPHFAPSQVFRIGLGWAQSIISIADLGADLRLWLYHERGFPSSAWLAALLFFYAAVAAASVRLLRGFGTLDERLRRVAIASAACLAINLAFALLWQGTDLERYFPSLPCQLLLAGAVLMATRAPSRVDVLAAGSALLALLLVVNWVGDFRPQLAADSFRQVWLRELRRNTQPTDVLVVLGPRKFGLAAPHDPRIPRIINVSMQVVLFGDRWAELTKQDIADAERRGGRVLLGDSLFGPDRGPRDGWSFTEHPRPTPAEIAAIFEPLKTDRIAFEVAGERLWGAK